MWEFFTEAIKLIRDPALIGAGITCGGLFWLLMRAQKQAKESEAARMAEREKYYTCIDTSMKETALTVNKLVTLVEILIYGRGRS
jgi:hypothetical protein